MTTKHTPGPWTIEEEPIVGVGNRKTGLSTKRIVAVQDGVTVTVTRLGDADDARLIAAAPTMLEALRLIVGSADPGEDATLTVDGYNAACSAIALAEGRTP